MCTVTNFEPKQRMQSILRTPWTSSTPSSARLVSTVEVRWRAESVLDGQGPGIPHRRGHIAGGCFIGRRGWLWTSTPVWYSEFVHSSQAHRLGWKTGAQQLTLFVSNRARAANRKTVSITRRRHRRPRDQLFFPEQRWEARRNRSTSSSTLNGTCTHAHGTCTM